MAVVKVQQEGGFYPIQCALDISHDRHPIPRRVGSGGLAFRRHDMETDFFFDANLNKQSSLPVILDVMALLWSHC